MHFGFKSLLSAGFGLAVTAGSIGLGLIYTQPVFASTKLFTNQKIVVKADPPGGSNPGSISPEEVFIFDLVTDDFITTVTKPGYINSGGIPPGIVTPTDPINPSATPDPGTLLTSYPYTFKGYKIHQILNGKRYENGVYTGDIKYRELAPYAGTNAEDVGVFNYAYNGGYPIDLIAHALPDDLWNPGGESLGFTSTSLPSSALDNSVSFGGFAFDVFDAGTSTFDEPYQIFTVSVQSTSGNFTGFAPGDYAGCPGSCRGAVVNPVPSPLPLLGAGAAFGFSRKLRKRIKGSKSPEVISAIG
jgi:hypothetical protein